MQDLIRRLKPDRFEDVVALVALFRPGPLQSGMVDDFISRKHGVAGRRHGLPASVVCKPVLEATYGVILYQEQVMKIAQVLSGYTLGGADLLRRAMGKKKPEEMAKQRSVFVEGAVARGVDARQAAHIFDLIEKFAGYGFNKSHSAAYAVLTYQTAWLKAHYPAAFMAAVLSADLDDTDKVASLLYECRERMQLTVLPPDVNAPARVHRRRRTARSAMAWVRCAVWARRQWKRWCRSARATAPTPASRSCAGASIWRALNRRVLEALIKAGAMDGLGAEPRHAAGLRWTRRCRVASRPRAPAPPGRTTCSEAAAAAEVLPQPLQSEWTERIRLANERETPGRLPQRPSAWMSTRPNCRGWCPRVWATWRASRRPPPARGRAGAADGRSPWPG